MTSAGDFLVDLARGMLDAVRPLEEAVVSTDAFEVLLARHGWEAPEQTDYLPDLQGVLLLVTEADAVVAAIEELVGREEFDVEDALEIASLAVDLIERLRALATSPPTVALPPPLDAGNFWSTFATDLTEDLVARYLEFFHPLIYGPLHLFGVIDETFVPANGAAGRIDYVRTEVHWSRLGRMLTAPTDVFAETYGWGQVFLWEKLLARLQRVLRAGGVPVARYRPYHELAADYYSPDNSLLAAQSDLRVPLFSGEDADGERFETGLALLPIPPRNEPDAAPSGLLIGPYFVGEAAAEVELGGPFLLQLRGGLEADSPVGIEVRPGDLSFRGSPAGSALDLGMTLVGDPSEPWILVGSPRSHHLRISKLEFGVELVGAVSSPDLRLRADTGELALVLDFSDGDGFLNQLLGSSTQVLAVQGALTWSSKTGLTFEGRAGLELSFAINKKLGEVAELERVTLKIQASEQKTEVTIGATGHGKLGPITASVENVGVALSLTPLGAGQRGTWGNLDIGFGFKAPTGIGIALDTGPISGGGFLAADSAAGRYSGTLALTVYSVSVKAFGLIETKFPDGRQGFSFVIVISAEFPSVQLGFGFTLLGMGGLIGINRGLDAGELSRLLLSGTAGNLLFPKDVVGNATAIVRDLGAVFPTREGHFVFGPLAKLGWGTPTLIRGEIGVVLELPGPVLAVLGEVRLRLPKAEFPLVSLNFSVGGVLDFPKKSFALDAGLHDSSINGFAVSGQMAMRLRWGEEPNFVLSVGGFHPAYKPPPNFPKLQPLTLNLGRGGSTSVTVSGFFAVTSNTLQIGGNVRLHAGGSGISLDATLGVKALFVFTPFSFEATIDASVKISFHGRGPSVHLHGALSGPTPWRARGELCVSILFWDACLRFNQTFGGGSPVATPEIDPWLGSDGSPEVIGLKRAIEDPANWSSEPPAANLAVVTLAEGSEQLVDPLGGLLLRQRVLPVETAAPITRFGAVKTPRPFVFKNVVATLEGGVSVPLVQRGTVQDFFAAAQYFSMNDAQKLSAKSFEKYRAGYRLSTKPNDLELGSTASKHVVCETRAIAADGSITNLPDYEPAEANLAAANQKSAVARFGFRQVSTQKYVDPRVRQAFSLGIPAFGIASVTNLSSVANAPPPASRSETLLALDDLIVRAPERRGFVQVVSVSEIVGI